MLLLPAHQQDLYAALVVAVGARVFDALKSTITGTAVPVGPAKKSAGRPPKATT